MQLRGFRLLRIGGIQVTVDYSWFIIFFLVIYSMAENFLPQTHAQYTKPQYWAMGLVAATLLFVSVLAHELAHSLVAVHHGVQVTSIRLFIFGGVSQGTSEPTSGRQEFLIALAGPAVNMILGFLYGIVFLYLFFLGKFEVAKTIAGWLAASNVMLAVFNLIPGFPLDGGRLLRAVLWDRWNDMARATKVVSQIGNGFALLLVVLGFLQFFFTQSIISGLWLILIGLFMKQNSLGSYQAVVLRQALTGVQVRQIMTRNLVTVDWLTSVDDLVREYVYKHQFTAFPAFNRDEFVGLVSLAQVKEVPKEIWGFKQVRDIMTPAEDVPSLHPGDDATEALSRMISNDLGRMLVMEDGRLVGIVSRRDIMNLFKIKSDLGLA
jgi:Zn-dependent protease/CBS domain-containing protein